MASSDGGIEALGVAVCEVLVVDEAVAVLVAGALLYADGLIEARVDSRLLGYGG